eukprot:TRINITY_DN8947_c1_g4_i1.p3 TRINITY_DN8947_c1_g4~~TRINITY_DN8947_c1_g4_i1.p3  ORF type:complete len:107 (+),score=14.60 TRINITY_DN8947_c1_g4_i1:24-323(+)
MPRVRLGGALCTVAVLFTLCLACQGFTINPKVHVRGNDHRYRIPRPAGLPDDGMFFRSLSLTLSLSLSLWLPCSSNSHMSTWVLPQPLLRTLSSTMDTL